MNGAPIVVNTSVSAVDIRNKTINVLVNVSTMYILIHKRLFPKLWLIVRSNNVVHKDVLKIIILKNILFFKSKRYDKCIR